MLWFDVESRYEATANSILIKVNQLWFDVESRYEATDGKVISEIT